MSLREESTDEEITEAVLAGDKEAFRILVDRYKGYIYNIILRIVRERATAEDLAQEVFIIIFRRLHDFRGKSSFSTWIYRIAVNKGIDWKRKMAREKSAIDGEKIFTSNVVNREGIPEEQLALKEDKALLTNLLDQLPEKYRIVFILFHLQEMSYQEVSTILQIPVKTVETRLYRGKKMIQKMIQGGGSDGKERNQRKVGFLS